MIIEFKTNIIEAINKEVAKSCDYVQTAARTKSVSLSGQLILYSSENPLYEHIIDSTVNQIPDTHTLIKTNLIDIQYHLLDKIRFKRSFFMCYTIPKFIANFGLFMIYLLNGMCVDDITLCSGLFSLTFVATAVYYILMQRLDKKFNREFSNKITFWPRLKKNINVEDLDRTIKIAFSDRLAYDGWGRLRVIPSEPASEPVFGQRQVG